MEDNYAFLTISPHGNIQHIIEEEQRNLSAEQSILPFYPLFCPIKKIESGTNSKKQRLILTEYQQLFQCPKTVFTLEQPCISGNALYRRLQWNRRDEISHGGLDFNGTKLQEYAFLYGNCKTNATGPSAEYVLQSLTFKVFRLCIITFTVNKDFPKYYKWKENCSIWTANNSR